MFGEAAIVILGIVFLVSIFVMFYFNGRIRKYRRAFRFGHAFSALTGMAAAILLWLYKNGVSPDRNRTIIFIIFVLIFGIPVFLYNLRFMILGEGDILTSTLENCSVTEVRGGKFRQRVAYRLEGRSREGNNDSFLLQYASDTEAVTMAPVTEDTCIEVRYYSESYSICGVRRVE